jgi:hypothetical protein
MQSYDDFWIEIDSGNGQGYPVRFRWRLGNGKGTMRFPYTDEELEAQLRQISKYLYGGHGAIATTALQDFGGRLYQALFFDELKTSFRVCQRSEAKGVRIRLAIEPPGLAGVPWEFLFDQELERFLALDRRTPIVRFPAIGVAPRDLKLKERTVRVLAMFATPKNAAQLDVESEKRQLTAALAGLSNKVRAWLWGKARFNLQWAGGQTVQVLQNKLQAGEYNIFHFIGHGAYRQESGAGEVAFSNAEGNGQPLTSTQLGYLVGSHDSLRLVVLNACEGAAGSEKELFSSVVTDLVQQGIPSVIGMRFEILDSTAIHFASGFYSALARGHPVDRAVVEGRIAIQNQDADNFEWGSPVHYLIAPDSELVQPRRPWPLLIGGATIIIAVIALLLFPSLFPVTPRLHNNNLAMLVNPANVHAQALALQRENDKTFLWLSRYENNELLLWQLDVANSAKAILGEPVLRISPPSFPNLDPTLDRKVLQMISDPNGNIWIAVENLGILVYNPRIKEVVTWVNKDTFPELLRFTTVSLASRHDPDRQGYVQVFLANGTVARTLTYQGEYPTKETTALLPLQQDPVLRVFTSNTDAVVAISLSTNGEVLWIISNQHVWVVPLRGVVRPLDSPIGNVAMSVVATDNTAWIGVNAAKRFYVVSRMTSKTEESSESLSLHQIESKNAPLITAVDAGRQWIWSGTNCQGSPGCQPLVAVDQQSQKILEFEQTLPKELEVVFAIAVDASGGVWIATDEGLFYYKH